MIHNKGLKLFIFSFTALLLTGCTTYKTMVFANDLTLLRKHLPTEKLWINEKAWEIEKWKRADSHLRYNIEIAEYTKPPETIKNWNELWTTIQEWKMPKIHEYPGGATFTKVPNPLTAMELVKQQSQALCKQPIEFKILEENKSDYYPSVTFYKACGEFKIQSPLIPTAEAQVYRIFQGKYGLHTVIRAKRAAKLDERMINEWTKYIRQVRVCDNKVESQKCLKKQ